MTDEQARAYVTAAAATLELPIPADCLPGTVANFQRIAGIADKVTGFALPDEVEPAPVFSHAKR